MDSADISPAQKQGILLSPYPVSEPVTNLHGSIYHLNRKQKKAQQISSNKEFPGNGGTQKESQRASPPVCNRCNGKTGQKHTKLMSINSSSKDLTSTNQLYNLSGKDIRVKM